MVIMSIFKGATILTCGDLCVYTLNNIIVGFQIGDSIKVQSRVATGDRTAKKQRALLGIGQFTVIPDEKFNQLVCATQLNIINLNNILFGDNHA